MTEPLWNPHEAMGGRDPRSRPLAVIGALSELRAAELLIERGHRVAKPVVDDFGIDLIVDYHDRPITVQVKCSRANVQSATAGARFGLWKFHAVEHVVAEVFMFHARPIDAWWIVPGTIIKPGKNIRIPEGRSRAIRSDAVHNFLPYRDQWGLFDNPVRQALRVLPTTEEEE